MANDNVINFPPTPPAGEQIQPEMLPAFLRAEAALARENHLYARRLFTHLKKMSEMMNRAKSPVVSAPHRAELYDAIAQSLNELVAAGFPEMPDAPDMSSYPEG